MAAVSSWIEQREFLSLAVDALGNLPLAKEIQRAWDELKASPPDLSGLSVTRGLQHVDVK